MFNAHVDRVIDGDTIVVTIDLGFDVFAKRKVRLLNADTSERGQKTIKKRQTLLRVKHIIKILYCKLIKMMLLVAI